MTLPKKGNYRWAICALLFLATTINYLDRQVIGLLKPVLENEFNWTEIEYGEIVMAFSAAYAIGQLIFGRLIDKVGTRIGYAISIVIWSVAAMGHALAKGTLGFAAMRSLLGLGESGNFPAAIKSTAEWFPKKERALATGIFNSGANIGAVLAPALVPWIALKYGWEYAFIWTGAIGFVWLILWLIFYQTPDKQKRLGKAEYDYIHSDEDEKQDDGKSISWRKLFGIKQTWAYVFGKFLTDPIWWFFLYWLPSYFSSAFHLDLKSIGLPLIVVYTATSVGSIGGGWLSGYLIKKGYPVFKARKIAMLIFAFCVVPIMFTKYVDNMWIIVGLISLAAAAHQAWSANIFTTASDMFPKKAVSSVVGIGGMAGAIGGMCFPMVVGLLLDHYEKAGHIQGGYNILFVICGFAYLVAWAVMHFFAPKMEKVSIQ